ncbi:MAG: hypothetical protein H6733_16045 [Alphaproteobacteria bacterium]|nr:hypothetical protein [Alphaproteobacteria bacterium]
MQVWLVALMLGTAYAGTDDGDTFIPFETGASDSDTDVDPIDTDTDAKDTDDTDVDTDVVVDTGLPYPYGGQTAADLAGDPGGCLGCNQGGGAAGAGLLAGLALVGLTRRRRVRG